MLTPSTLVFACYEKVCAPPPVGSGGSSGSRKGKSGKTDHVIKTPAGSYRLYPAQDSDHGWEIYDSDGQYIEYGGSLKDARHIIDRDVQKRLDA